MLHIVVRLLPVVVALPAILLGLRYRSTMSASWRYAWWSVIALVIVGETVPIISILHRNVATVPEWDFLGFWLNAHVAAAGHNFYDPAQAQALATGMSFGSEFRREILEVGFWYPAPSMFVFLPLALFSNVHAAYAVWYAIQIAAFFLAAVVLTRCFLKDCKPFEGTAAIAALLLLMPATLSTVTYGQTSVLALLFTSLFWSTRSNARGGFWLVLAALTKPFLGALSLALLCCRKWRTLGSAIATTIALCAASAAAFGLATFLTYFRARPDAHIPAWVYAERTNQSLLGFILRASHQQVGAQLPHAAFIAYALVAVVMALVTIWLCLHDAERDSEIALGLALTLALTIYPVTQSFYAVLMILPALILCRRAASGKMAFRITTAGIVVAYVLMAIHYDVLAFILGWCAFAAIAAPSRIRRQVQRLSSLLSASVTSLARADASARVSAIGLTTIFCLFIAAVAAHDVALPTKSLSAGAGTDFRAFYCSGVSANAKAAPYLLEPLRSCEHRVQPAKGWSNDLVVPSPLPGYDIAFFGALARVPYVFAKLIWLTFSLACLFFSAWLLARLTHFPPLMILLGLALVDGYEALHYGQIPPFVVAALCAAAYSVERRRYSAAAAAAALAMLEPHVGLPACLAMFLWIPQTRISLTAGGVLLGAVSVFTTGMGANFAYLTHFLPEQAAAELVAIDQFSLSHQLHLQGLSDAVSLRVGLASYFIMTTLGIIVARRVALALDSDALIVTLPVAAAVLGGTYIHDIQFAAALPCAFILAARAKEWRNAAWVALMLLIFPWFSLGATKTSLFFPTSAIALAALVWFCITAERGRPMRRTLFASAAVLLFLTMQTLFGYLPLPATIKMSSAGLPASVLSPDASATSNWAAYLRANPQLSTPSPRKELEKVPTWLAIAILLVTAGVQRRQREGTAAQARTRIDAHATVASAISFETSRCGG